MEEGTANITAKSQTNPDVLPSPTLTKENISESASNVMMDDVLAGVLSAVILFAALLIIY